uniref:SCP domain-containing protein n=1 Tax=Anopheles atroparvus TaxID=41427 RepID=A0AAG5D0P4_ANOAO
MSREVRIRWMIRCVVLATVLAAYTIDVTKGTKNSHQATRYDPFNYCDEDYCPAGKRNVGCGCDFNAPIGPGCVGKDATLHRPSGRDRQLILHEHNLRRNQLACGHLNRFRPAARMVQVHWNDELQALAECNVKNCTYGHDQCRSTERFRYAGQNIAKRTVCGRELKLAEVVNSSLNAWFDEYLDTTVAHLANYPHSEPHKPIGHFTLMVNDNVYFLGCALMSYAIRIDVYFRETGEHCRAYYFACNYSFINLKDQPTYGEGTKPTDRCRAHIKNKRYGCLCGEREPYSTLMDWDERLT